LAKTARHALAGWRPGGHRRRPSGQSPACRSRSAAAWWSWGITCRPERWRKVFADVARVHVTRVHRVDPRPQPTGTHRRGQRRPSRRAHAWRRSRRLWVHDLMA